MGNYTIFVKFENPRRGRLAIIFLENDPKILDFKSSSEQIIFRKLSLGAPVKTRVLNFRLKNTPLKDKKWKEKVQKNAQLSFCVRREAFFILVFFTTERMVCFEMQPRQ